MDDRIIVNVLVEDPPSDAQLELWLADRGYRVVFWNMLTSSPNVLDKFNFMFELANEYLLQSSVKTLFVTSDAEYISSDFFQNDFSFKITTQQADPSVGVFKIFGFGTLDPDLTLEIIFRIRTYIESEYVLGANRGQDFIDETMDQIINEYLRRYENIRI